MIIEYFEDDNGKITFTKEAREFLDRPYVHCKTWQEALYGDKNLSDYIDQRTKADLKSWYGIDVDKCH